MQTIPRRKLTRMAYQNQSDLVRCRPFGRLIRSHGLSYCGLWICGDGSISLLTHYHGQEIWYDWPFCDLPEGCSLAVYLNNESCKLVEDTHPQYIPITRGSTIMSTKTPINIVERDATNIEDGRINDMHSAERSLRTRIDFFILPTVALLFLMCFVDRTNIGTLVA